MKQLLSLVVALVILVTGSEAQISSSFFPSSEYTYGTYTPTLTPCFSSNINRNSFSLFPTMHTFSFTSATALMYLRIWSDNLIPFYANLVAGGVGTKGFTSVQVSSLHGGYLAANVQAFCV